MACNASKAPLLRVVAARGFAAQASPKTAACGATGVQTTTLPNKMVVASQDSKSGISRVSIQFRAGSRNETYQTLGASHVLRSAAGLTTSNATTFGITRNLQQVGAGLTVTGDREVVSYTIEVTQDHLETGLKFLEAATSGQVFKPWELQENLPRLQNELSAVPNQVKAVELLHKAAFHDGLGNSIYIPDHNVGKISSETMQHFFTQTCTANRAAVSGVGIDHNSLVGYAQALKLNEGSGPTHTSSFHQGEIRCDASGNMATVAIATEAAGWGSNMKECMAFCVLQFAAGVGPVTKYGANNGVITKAMASACKGPIGASALHNCYSDSGLFGFVVTGRGKCVGKAVEAGVKTLRSASISDADFNRGKAGVRAWIANIFDSDASLVQELGQQAVLTGSVVDNAGLMSMLESVTAADVQAAAKKAACGKLSIAAVGNLGHIPYLDQLH